MTARKTSDSVVELLIRFVRVGHEAGYPTADVEDRVLALATISGITAAFDTFVTATAIAYGLIVSAVILPGRFQPAGSGPESLVRSG